MKTVFSSHSEVAHNWANQTQSEGRTKSMFFERTKIYSYGKHYLIADIVKPNVILFNSIGSSPTTQGKHKVAVRRAIPEHFRVFDVPDAALNHSANITQYCDLFIANIEGSLRAHINTAWQYENAISLRATLMDYLNVFDLTIDDYKELPNAFNIIHNLYLTDELKAKIDIRISSQMEKARLANERKQRKQEEVNEELRKLIPNWLLGEEYITRIASLPEIYLRVNKELRHEQTSRSEISTNHSYWSIETSKGARISYDAGKRLFSLIHSGKDVKGFNIDGYTVISMNGVLTVGCHKIERDEIYRFATLMKWI